MSPDLAQTTKLPVRYSYDGGFQSYLAAVSEILNKQTFPFEIRQESPQQNETLFGDEYKEAEQRKKAERFWTNISKKGLHIPRLIYFAFLSEQEESAQVIAEYLCLVYGHTDASARERKDLQQLVNRWARAVEAEKLNCENQAVFLRKKNRIPVCYLKPKYNVLPLLTRHFRNQLGNLNWGVYDQQRAYGIQVREGKLSYWNNTDNLVDIHNWKSSPNQGSAIRKAV